MSASHNVCAPIISQQPIIFSCISVTVLARVSKTGEGTLSLSGGGEEGLVKGLLCSTDSPSLLQLSDDLSSAFAQAFKAVRNIKEKAEELYESAAHLQPISRLLDNGTSKSR